MNDGWAPSSSATLGDTGNRAPPTAQIVGFRMGLMTAEDVEAYAAKEVTGHAVYERNQPKLDGPIDPAMGTHDRRVECARCRNGCFKCQGHMGMHRLPVPVYHPGFIDKVYKLMQGTCWACCRLLGDVSALAPVLATLRPEDRFTTTIAYTAGTGTCPWCCMPQPAKWSRTGLAIHRSWTDAKTGTTDKKLDLIKELGGDDALADAKRRFTPADALDVLRNMDRGDIVALGMDPDHCPPHAMVLANLAIMPPNARPAIMASEGSKRRGQDDTTTQIQDIVKTSRTLRRILAGVPSTNTDKAAAAVYLTECGTKVEGGVPPGALTAAEVKALYVARHAGGGTALFKPGMTVTTARAPGRYHTVTPEQASRIWDAHPVLCERLQNDVAFLMDNSGAVQAQQRNGAPKRGITQRLVGKTGQIRGAGVAKRCDLTARTVVAPDSVLDVDEVGVPDNFMNTLTLPEEVNARNIDDLAEAVRRGPGVPNGADRIIHANGDLTQLALVPDRGALVLATGDVVERHLRDGDRVCFNRQPSLHRLSFQAPRVRRVPDKAIRMPAACTTPYNADFDGDEMNQHALQGMMPNAEAQELMAVSRNVMNPQNNAPCLGLVQDARVGGMLLTRRSTVLDRDEMHQAMGAIKYPIPGKEAVPSPAGYNGTEPFWTGKQLVSVLLPPLFLERRVRNAGPDVGVDDPDERYVLIVNGELLHGTLCKETLGAGQGSIVHRIAMEHGEDVAVRFMSDFQRVLYAWMRRRGLTFGLRDCLIEADTRARIDELTAEADALVSDIITEATALEHDLTVKENALVESLCTQALNNVLDYASRLVMDRPPQAPDGFRAITAAGSKGNTNNIAMVTACLGQQIVNGSRAHPCPQSRRTLPSFPPGAPSAVARGFIRSSYAMGLAPEEYFHHMMAGREGLVATAVRTAETGYTQRSMMAAASGDVVAWDATVRNAQNYILTFVAGGDGFDPCRLQRVDIGAALKATDADVDKWASGDAQYAATFRKVRDRARWGFVTHARAEPGTKGLVPVNVRDELVRAKFDAGKAGAEVPDGDAPAAAAAVLQLVADVVAMAPSAEAVDVFVLHVLYEARPHALAAAGLTGLAFSRTVAHELLYRTQIALVHPGESVGVIAAQSIGEPATQFTLNAFHFAGLALKPLTAGVPRLKELHNASWPIRTPTMTLPVKAGVTTDVATLAASLPFLCIDSVLHTSYVMLEDAAVPSVKDTELVAAAKAVFGPEPAGASPWVLRLVLNAAILKSHGFIPELVAREVASQLPEYDLCMVYSQPTATQWVLRLRLLDGNLDDCERATRRLHADLRATVLLGGVDSIRDAHAGTAKFTDADPATGGLRTYDVPCVDVEGSGLMKVATRDWVDWPRTRTNDVVAVAQCLGIIAARNVLFNETYAVACGDSGYVDPRHVAHIVTAQTHRGDIMRFTRFGINRVDTSALHRAAYEEPVDMLLQSAMVGAVDPLAGICESVLFGLKPAVGTGTVAVQQDVEEEDDNDAMFIPSRHRVGLTSREQRGAQGSAHKPRGKRVRDEGPAVPAPARRRVLVGADAAAAWSAAAAGDVGTIIATDETGWRLTTPVLYATTAPTATRGPAPAQIATPSVNMVAKLRLK
jgi:DNA-directed RNA polymerase II subunit RPB1